MRRGEAMSSAKIAKQEIFRQRATSTMMKQMEEQNMESVKRL